MILEVFADLNDSKSLFLGQIAWNLGGLEDHVKCKECILWPSRLTWFWIAKCPSVSWSKSLGAKNVAFCRNRLKPTLNELLKMTWKRVQKIGFRIQMCIEAEFLVLISGWGSGLWTKEHLLPQRSIADSSQLISHGIADVIHTCPNLPSKSITAVIEFFWRSGCEKKIPCYDVEALPFSIPAAEWRTSCWNPTVCWRPLAMPKQTATTIPAALESTWTSTLISRETP